MNIYFKKNFLKQYKKLPKQNQAAVDDVLKRFEHNPTDPALYNHALSGKLKGYRSIAAKFDLRIVFAVHDDYVVVILIGVGSHNQVY